MREFGGEPQPEGAGRGQVDAQSGPQGAHQRGALGARGGDPRRPGGGSHPHRGDHGQSSGRTRACRPRVWATTTPATETPEATMATRARRDYYEVLGVDRDAAAGRDQEGLPQARGQVPPRPQPGRPGGRGEVQGGIGGLRGALGRRQACALRSVRAPGRRRPGLLRLRPERVRRLRRHPRRPVRLRIRRHLRRRGAASGATCRPAARARPPVHPVGHLEEAARGGERTIRIPRTTIVRGLQRQRRPAGQCARDLLARARGQGQVMFRRGFLTVAQTCPSCGGQGRVNRNPCGECRGDGRVEPEATPPGAGAGRRRHRDASPPRR